ncbi:MAG: glucoamylase family protein, partial [Acidobacteriota bacterium]
MTLAAGLHEHAGRIAADDTLVAHLEALARRASAVVEPMTFDFLYDPQRQLFAVGYRLADADGPGRLDASYYDLLASEARLASFVAIAKGDVPAAHWFRLGRSVTNVHGAPVLLSWSATMFEYLMPSLVLRVFPGTLLEASCRFAVRRQIDYGRERDVPWGISESAYALMDRHDTYQYKAFGVPGLGLARGIGDELVVAPYATALAALVAPVRAIANLRRLEGLGARGAFGFFEAIDYSARDHEPTEGAQPQSGRATVVRAYMSHHQGMSVVACANAVLGDVMVSRFHRDPRVAATEMLLQERAPHPAPSAAAEPVVAVAVPARASAVPVRRYRSPHTAVPHAQFLSNGRYTTVVTNGGGGASTWNGRAVTRWRRDATRDPGSHAVYLRDVRGGATWSAAYQPTMVEADEYAVTFHSDKACFVRRDGDIASQLDIAVSPEDDVEVRRLTLRNRGLRGRDIEVTSYAELALTAAIDDLAHPAFGKLFVETHYSPENTALLCHRRPRSGNDELWAVHVLSLEGVPAGATEWETDRERFLGRGRGPRFPCALDGRPLSGTTGVVLDAICSLRQRVRLAPAGHVRLSFSTGVAPTREAALALAQKYHHPAAAGRAFALAFSHARSVLHHLGASSEDARLFERLASCLLYVDESGRSPVDLEANTLGQSGLWRHGISGDLPILLVRAGGSDGDIALVTHVVQAQEYWRLKGLQCDVVIVNEHPISYLDEMQARFVTLLDSGPWRQWQHQPGGVYLLRRDHLNADERTVLAAVARVALTSTAGDLGAQLDLLASRRHAVAPGPALLPIRVVERAPVEPPPLPALGLTTGLGGFSPDGRAFIVPLADADETPQPWVNVIATPHFGTLVTAAGAAFTWALNSRENRLTPFANDPVVDPTAEALFIRDDESGVVTTPTPGPRRRRSGDGRVDVRHEPGRSSFTRSVDGLDTVLEVFVDGAAPVKISRLRLTNTGSTKRQLSLFAYNDWALGPPRDGYNLHVVTSYDGDRGAVLARNHFNEGFRARVAFLAASAAPSSATADRAAFFGRHGSFDDAVAFTTPTLAPRFGAGLDPCAVLQVSLTLAPGESREVAFILGQGDDEAHAHRLIDEFRPLERTRLAGEAACARWTEMLDVVQVRTPDDSFDVMMNGWLLYQTLSCRIDARTGYFQPGGAFGFRDQLQDVLALCHARPDVTRAHLLRAASRQYVEGDVQHWWH